MSKPHAKIWRGVDFLILNSLLFYFYYLVNAASERKRTQRGFTELHSSYALRYAWADEVKFLCLCFYYFIDQSVFFGFVG